MTDMAGIGLWHQVVYDSRTWLL